MWVKLSSDAEVGVSLLELQSSVDWLPGMEVVITSTSYDFRQTEKHRITEILNDGLTLRLQESLQYLHLGKRYDGNDYDDDDDNYQGNHCIIVIHVFT